MHAMLADAGFAFGFVLIMALAAVVAIVGVFGLVLRIMGAIFRGLFGHGCGPQSPPQMTAAPRGVIECPQPHCAHLNPPGARFCAQCGVPLKR